MMPQSDKKTELEFQNKQNLSVWVYGVDSKVTDIKALRTRGNPCRLPIGAMIYFKNKYSWLPRIHLIIETVKQADNNSSSRLHICSQFCLRMGDR